MKGFTRYWFTVREAARALSTTPAALRKQLERRARRAPDGGTEARLDGIRARKISNRWRVSFDEPWTK
jgi:hypothetical protein